MMADLAAKLSPNQRKLVMSARQNDIGEWRVRSSEPGYRGLPALGIAYSRSHATKAPGALGLLTARGVELRDFLASQ